MEAGITRTERAIDAFLTSGNSPTVCVDLGDWTPEVRYELTGTPDGELVAVLGGISAGRHLITTDSAPGWWDSQVGHGRPIDPEQRLVLSFDFVGGPGTARPPGRLVTTHDQAKVLAAILDEIGRDRIEVLVGASYGGMVGLAFAETYPDRCRRLVVLCAAHRAHPMSTAWRSLQRRIVRLADGNGNATEGLELARALAMTTYRSAPEFEERFAGEPVAAEAGPEFPVESYLAARGRDFSRRFDADAFIALSESIDAHRVDPAAIAIPTCLVACDTDALVPPWLVEELRDGLAGPLEYHLISSRTGHDAFLTETEAVGTILRRVLDREPGPAAQTRCVRASVGTDPAHGAVMPPIYLSSNYTFADLGVKRVHDYTRTSNPTRDQLAEALADLAGC